MAHIHRIKELRCGGLQDRTTRSRTRTALAAAAAAADASPQLPLAAYFADRVWWLRQKAVTYAVALIGVRFTPSESVKETTRAVPVCPSQSL